MPAHLFGPLFSAPHDPAHIFVALLIGIAGGFFLGELRVRPLLARTFARRKRPAPPPESHGGPWG